MEEYTQKVVRIPCRIVCPIVVSITLLLLRKKRYYHNTSNGLNYIFHEKLLKDRKSSTTIRMSSLTPNLTNSMTDFFVVMIHLDDFKFRLDRLGV